MRQVDNLALQVQSAYYCAYWNSWSKHKKSLQSILRAIYASSEKQKKKKVKIDVEKVSKQFRQMEELIKDGWTKETDRT